MVPVHNSGLQTHDPLQTGASRPTRKARVPIATLTVWFSCKTSPFSWLTLHAQGSFGGFRVEFRGIQLRIRFVWCSPRSHGTCSFLDADSDTNSQKPKSKKQSKTKIVPSPPKSSIPPRSKVSAKSKVKTPAPKSAPPSSKSEGESSTSSGSGSSDSDDGEMKKSVPSSKPKGTKTKKTVVVSPKSESRGWCSPRFSTLCQ